MAISRYVILKMTSVAEKKYSLPSEDKKAQYLLGKILADGLSQNELNAAYDDVSKDYDQVVLDNGYKAPNSCAEAVTKLFPEKDRASLVTLDIGAGTGLLAEEMLKKGFKTLDALDPSQGMLDIAQEKGIYRNYICDAIGKEPLKIPADSYDIVTVVGSHIANHIESEALIETIRLVKSGGIVCIVARMESLSNLDKYKDSFFPLCDDLEKAGKWTKIECSPCPYWNRIQGVQLVYRVC